MRRKTTTAPKVVLFLGSGVLALVLTVQMDGCSSCPRWGGTNERVPDVSESGVQTEKQALQIAVQALRDRHHDPEEYEADVVKDESNWRVRFTSKLAPEGGEIVVDINAHDGSINVLYGE